MSNLRFHVCETALGWAGFLISDKGLRAITLPNRSRDAAVQQVMASGARPANEEEAAPIASAIRSLVGGKAPAATPTIDWTGITPFRRKVLEACAAIPPGQTRTYRQLAEQVGKPTAARAVGRVMATNPWPLLIPCHRVVGSGGGLHGYGGGLEMKAHLLRAEGARV